MNPIKSRAWSFAIITTVYIIAAATGIVVCFFLPFDFWLNLLLADIAATVVVFLFSLIFRNASVYDPYWSVQPVVIAVAVAAGGKMTAAGVLIIIAILVWGVRLTANWAYTFRGLEHQDWRYSSFKEKAGGFYPLVNFFGFHLMPTLVVYACVLPAAYVLREGADLNAGSVIFFAVALSATLLQGVSDFQMHRFRKSGVGGFIRDGVWKYSRHPNYLGEIVMWWGVGLAAVCSMPQIWYLLAGALANTLMFIFISIPLADGHQSRKAGFVEYKKATRMLLPVRKSPVKVENTEE